MARADFGLQTGSAADTKKEQRPPPPATPLDFPHYTPSDSIYPFEKTTAKSLYSHFASIQKPSDVSSKHVDSLNLQVLHDQALEDIVPRSPQKGASFLPDEDAGTLLPQQKMLCNGRECPDMNIYHSRRAELMIDNESGFRAAQRLSPRPGQPATKPGYFYKFWQGLYLMSQYWDADLPRQQGQEDQEMETVSSTAAGEESDVGLEGRTGTGREMPDQFREDTVRAFVEVVTWLFGCQLSPPRLPPRIALQSSFFSIRLSYSVFRTPTDRQKARQGIVEGPVMGVQSRSETKFRAPEQAVGSGQAEALDLLREVGAMLLLAQERLREGKERRKPGEGKWYTSTPRWGGGSGGESENTAGNVDEAGSKGEDTKPGSRKRSRRQNNSDAYQNLWPGLGTWDPRVEYIGVGKEKESEIDDVFLISSINHHVAILRLRVSEAYMKFLECGETPAQSTASREGETQPWYALRLHRSRWFNLFSAEDRIEAMRGIWGVMAWLMRDTRQDQDREGGKDTVMTGQ